jgi:fused signal recognition particle receptor
VVSRLAFLFSTGICIETELGIPVKLVGLGETVGDLAPFDPQEFVDALFEG